MKPRTQLTRMIFAIAAATILWRGSVHGEDARDLKSRIDPLARPLIEGKVAVGFIIGVLEGDKTEFFAYGETERGSGDPPDADTVYEIGSITKVFTAILLTDAAERGVVRLEDPIQKHLPATVTVPVQGKPITLEHLATHTSGLPRLPANMKPADMMNPYADYTVEQLYASLNGHRLRREPGEYEYSNYAVGLLGHILARASGQTYEKLLVDRILEPLGMDDTRITLSESQRKRLASPYDASLEPAKNWDLPTLAGAGALRSTARDMLRFAKASLGDGSGSLAAALESVQSERLPIPGGLAMGLGWHIAGDKVTRWHDGGTGGYHAWLAVVRDRDLAVVVLANTSSEQISAFGENVTRAAAGMEVKPPVVRQEIQVGADELAKYVGFYALTPEFGLDVTIDGGRLMVQATGQGKHPVFASGPGEFFYKVVDAQLTFHPGPKGKADRVVLHQGGQDMEGVRKP